jgi:hypothetical protein
MLGERRRWADGELLFEAGKPGPGLFVVLDGEVAITRRDGLGNDLPVVTQGVGQFLAEVGQLSGKPAFVDGRAVGDVEALLITPEACAPWSWPKPNRRAHHARADPAARELDRDWCGRPYTHRFGRGT